MPRFFSLTLFYSIIVFFTPISDFHSVEFPFPIYNDSTENLPFSPSGTLGNDYRIKQDLSCSYNPYQGDTCIKYSYLDTTDWAGVVWQNPARNWGAKVGGKNLDGASKFTFWARGEDGGEVVDFGIGIIGSEEKYYDTAIVRKKDVILTKEWQKITIDLEGKDLSRIVSGFYWMVKGQSKPIHFYLDELQYE